MENVGWFCAYPANAPENLFFKKCLDFHLLDVDQLSVLIGFEIERVLGSTFGRELIYALLGTRIDPQEGYTLLTTQPSTKKPHTSPGAISHHAYGNLSRVPSFLLPRF